MEIYSERRSERIANQRTGIQLCVNQRRNGQRAIRKCSFCRQPGHTITKCNSDRLQEFEAVCVETVRNINIPDDFKRWLMDNYVGDQVLLKTFVITRMGFTNNSVRTRNVIDLITEYIFTKYGNREQIIVNNNNILSNNVSDNDISNLENDLIHFLGNLRNNRIMNRRQNTAQNIQNIEILRELLSFVYNANMNSRMQEFNEIAPRKLNINLVIDVSDDTENSNCQCNICWDDKPNNSFVKFGCNHDFCKDCVISSFRSEQISNSCCALCRSEIKTITTKTTDVYSELSEFVA